MSSSTQCDLKKNSSLNEEFSIYKNLAQEAEKNGNPTLAARWNLAAELVRGFIEYLESSRQITLLLKLTEQASSQDRTIETQEIAQYTTLSLKALVNHDMKLAQKFTRYAEETKAAGVRCRHWLNFIKDEIASQHKSEEVQLDQLAIAYRAKALKAVEEGKNEIAQHWSEAACLAQEAARKKNLSTASYIALGNILLSSCWDSSRDASFHAAKLKVEVALALEQGDSNLAKAYDSLALLAEKISICRENLVNAITNNKMITISEWRNAADFLSKSLEISTSLLLAPQEEPILSYQKAIAMAAEKTAESYRELIPKREKKGDVCLSSVTFATQSYEEATRALLALQENDFSGAAIAKKRSILYSEAAYLSKKAFEAKAQWYTLRVSFLYWTYRLKRIKSAIKKN